MFNVNMLCKIMVKRLCLAYIYKQYNSKYIKIAQNDRQSLFVLMEIVINCVLTIFRIAVDIFCLPLEIMYGVGMKLLPKV